MQFTKPFLTYEQQADRLISLGMQGDRSKIISCLRNVSYFRLSGYWYPFRKQDPSNSRQKLSEFYPTASIDLIWERYVFDRRLRLLLMDAIERIEVDARSRLTYFHAERHGPFGYADESSTLPSLSTEDRDRLLEGLRKQAESSKKEIFVAHFRDKYGSEHPDLPIWVACELMTFGHLFTFYRGCAPEVQKELASQYNIQDAVCLSWLKTLNTIRNICAHHSRLWNRVHGLKPSIPSKDPLWTSPQIPNDRVFCILTICRYLLSIIAPENDWTDRLKALLAEYPRIPRDGLGLIPGWESHPVWTR